MPTPLPVTVGLQIMGSLRPRFQNIELGGWSSLFFEIRIAEALPEDLFPEPPKDATGYTDAQLEALLAPLPGCQLTIGILDAALDDGYYMRRLSGNRAVISTHEVAPLLIDRGYRIQNFIYRNVYQLVIGFLRFEGQLPSTTERKLAHTPTRGCVFDWNGNREDILNSLDSPTLCAACREHVRLTVVHHLLGRLMSELARIRKPVLMRAAGWIRNKVDKHPWLAIIVPVVGGLVLNLAARALYDWLKPAAAPPRPQGQHHAAGHVTSDGRTVADRTGLPRRRG